MRIFPGVGLVFLLSTGAGVCEAQSVTGLPIKARIRVETSTDGRQFQLFSDITYYRDSRGRVRVNETFLQPNGDPMQQVSRIAVMGQPSGMIFTQLDHKSRLLWQKIVVEAKPSSPASARHHHPFDGRPLGTCAFGSQLWSPDFPRIEIKRCERITPGLSLRWKSRHLTRRETIYEAEGGEPAPEMFDVPSGYTFIGTTVLFTPGPSLRDRPYLPPYAATPFFFNRPKFTPGEKCDEFRLAGKENVVWQCKQKEPPLQHTGNAKIT